MIGERLRHRLPVLLASITIGLCGFPAIGQEGAPTGGFTPEEALRRMVLPEGFRAEVFASEPMVRQPLTLSFDDKGRAWVIEYLQYPNPAGLKPVTVDVYLRTEYDRVPEPPPKGPRGADRVKILEDTDGDGRADKESVFVEGLNLASGLAVGHGGVFVAQAPYLLFYADRDQDDRPDGDPEVLLTGFGLQDAHSTVNSLQWGPDGWLYGTQGSTVTARIRGYEFQQGIWRYHPVTKVFELFAEGGGNTWGLDFDASGNAFGSSNGGFITFHMLQGGNFWKGFAKHGPLHNPNSFGYFDAISYDGPKVGGHVTPGGIFYNADAYPASFRGAFIGGNLLSNAVYWHDLKPEGSTFRGKHGGTFLDSHDRWFRPIDLQVGPDGCVYVVDWYDKRASHLDPRDNWDRTNGRIYRIVHGERPKVPPFDLAKWPTDALIGLRTHPNDWWVRQGRRILSERRDPDAPAKLKALLRDDRDELTALRDLWALHAGGGLDDSTALGLLEHSVAGVRRWTVRLLGDDRRMNPSLLASLRSLATDDPDPLVRSQLAASCQRWGTADALAILDRLTTHDVDLKDRQIPLMLWWAIEKHWRDDPDAILGFFTTNEVKKRPLVREMLLERVARAFASRGTDADLAACARLLDAFRDQAESAKLLLGMEIGLAGRKFATVPAPLKTAFDAIWDRSEQDVTLVRLSGRLGHPGAVLAAVQGAADRGRPNADRLAFVELLGQLAPGAGLAVLLGLAEDSSQSALQGAALNALGGFESPEVASRLIAGYPKLSSATRERVLTLLASRPSWATLLLGAMEAKAIDPRDLRPSQVLQVAQLNDQGLKERLERVWGRVPGPGSPEKIRRIAEVRGMLPEGDKGDARRGQPLFKEHCAVCHKLFGEGESIGPELTGTERGSLDFLLTSMVDPSALIRKEYEAQSVALVDGRVLTGLVVEESPQSVTLIDANRQKTVVPRDKIEEMKPSTVSLMPEGMLDKLPEGQVRDLFRYLQSAGPLK